MKNFWRSYIYTASTGASLYEKINLLDEAAVVRGLNSLSRTRAALRDMLEESEKRVGQV